MSAIAVLLEKQRAHVISDTAATMGCKLWGHCVKALPVPHMNMVVAVRGNTRSVSTIHRLVAEYDDLDQMLAQAPLRLRAVGGLMAKLWPSRYGFEVIIAGVREGKAFAWFLSSRHGYVWQNVDGACVCGATDALAIEVAIEGFDIDRRDTRNLDAAAVRLLDLQRQACAGTVGGFGQITTVGQGVITTRIVKRWPDQLGKKLPV